MTAKNKKIEWKEYSVGIKVTPTDTIPKFPDYFDKRHKWGEGRAVWVDKPYRTISEYVYQCRVCGKERSQVPMDYAVWEACQGARQILLDNIFKKNPMFERLSK